MTDEEKQLTKAKEIIKNLVDSLIAIYGEQIKKLKTVKEADTLLPGNVIRSVCRGYYFDYEI